MKRFETLVGTQIMAWVASDTLTISRKAGVVTVVQQITPQDGTGTFPLKTVFNLNVLPMYSFA